MVTRYSRYFMIFMVVLLTIAMAVPAFARTQDDDVVSASIMEADGTTGQDTNAGSGIKTGHIQDGAVTASKIADGAVTDAKISGPISPTKILSTGLDADTVDGMHAAELAPAVHTHDQADVTGLDAVLSGKADVAHDHNGIYAPTSHHHDGSDIVSGKISTDRLNVGTTAGTVAAGNHTHSAMQKYSNVVVVAKSGGDYTSVQQALSSINPTADNPYLVKVMPGIYSEGTINLKDYADIQGSGANNTVIKSNGAQNKMLYATGAVNCEISDLSLIADIPDGHNGSYYILYLNSQTYNGSVIKFSRVDMTMTGNNIVYGYALNVFRNDIAIVDSTIRIDLQNSRGSIAITNYDCDMIIAGSKIETYLNGIDTFILSMCLNQLGGDTVITDSDLYSYANVVSANNYDATIVTGGCSGGCGTTPKLEVLNSTIEGYRAIITASTNSVPSEAYLASTQITGFINGSSPSTGTAKTVHCYDGNFDPIANQ